VLGGSSARRKAIVPTSSRRRFLGRIAAGFGAALVASPAARVLAVPQAATAPGRRPTALVTDAICKCHLTGPDAPECPQRYDAVFNALKGTSYFGALKPFHARAASPADIALCHTEAYVGLVHREIESGATRLSTGDTRICRQSLTAACYAAGSACAAVDAVLTSQAQNAFSLMRPPGHHATANRGMGFCVFNNAGIAARYAQKKYGLGKVLIIDWDVHHGNGTQDIFYDDDSVFYFSTHQHPWYPGTGAVSETGRGRGLGATLNCPLPAGSGRAEFLHAFNDRLLPAMDRFKPELVILSAGFDARQGDPKGQMRLTDQDFIDLTGIVLGLARQHSHGQVVSLMEGGYSLTGLAAGATAHVSRLVQG